MTDIPPEALPVVKIIRRDVPRPKDLPRNYFGENGVLRFWKNKMLCCPMGLHHKARTGVPVTHVGFPLAMIDQVKAFGRWWDSQTDPKAACDALWGAT